MLTSTKPNKCKHCKKRMPEDQARHVLHKECIEPWSVAFLAKKQAKEKADRLNKAKAERADTRERKEAVKRTRDLLAEAQVAFNAFIRARDAGLPCICCGKPFEPEKPGGAVDAGHFRSRGAAPQLRFDEDNVFAQRKNCNRPGGTTYAAFRAGVVARIGEARVQALESNDQVIKWDRDTLRQIKVIYRAKARALKKEQQ